MENNYNYSFISQEEYLRYLQEQDTIIDNTLFIDKDNIADEKAKEKEYMKYIRMFNTYSKI